MIVKRSLTVLSGSIAVVLLLSAGCQTEKDRGSTGNPSGASASGTGSGTGAGMTGEPSGKKAQPGTAAPDAAQGSSASGTPAKK